MPNLTIYSSHFDILLPSYRCPTLYPYIYFLRREVISRLHPLMGMGRIKWNVMFGICSRRKIGWISRVSEIAMGRKSVLMEDNPPVPSKVSVSKTAGIPTLYTLQVEDGRVYAMYSGSQVQNLRLNVLSFLKPTKWKLISRKHQKERQKADHPLSQLIKPLHHQ
jgi:hypothetical protein